MVGKQGSRGPFLNDGGIVQCFRITGDINMS